MDSKLRLERRLRAHFSGLHVVRPDARDHAVGVHVRVDDDDLDARARRVVDGLRVFRVADGGKDNCVRAVADGLPDVFVLRLVVLFRFRAKDGQIDVIFGLCRVRAREDRFPELRRGRFDNHIHFIRLAGNRPSGAPGQRRGQQERENKRQYSFFHRLTPSASSACAR